MMKSPVRNLLILIVPAALLVVLLPTIARSIRPQQVPNSSQVTLQSPAEEDKTPAKVSTIVWQTDLNTALRLAEKQHKPLMLDFYTDWCSACKILDRYVYTDAKVEEMAKKFITVKLNPEKDERIAQLALKLGISGFPTILYATSKGKPVHGMVGFSDVDGFVAEMQKSYRGATKDL